ncbi:hypothetical protein HDU67_002657 [Dinochytrium kinnereticum]|nr:hypothetical protein HDU67_002657 [Dinochytrium kinnereticum]
MSRPGNHRKAVSGAFGAVLGLGIGLLSLSIAMPTPVMAGDMLVCNNYTRNLPADFLFAIDASGSMCPYINQIEATLQRFIDELTTQNVNASFSIVVFGDMPQIILPFNTNATLTQMTLANVGCSKGGQEAGLEVIRMSLANNNGSDFGKACVSPFTSSSCNLNWRSGAKKHIILATDEDSDLPFTTAYRLPNQPRGLCALTYDWSGSTCSGGFLFEPPFEPRVFWPTGRQFYRNSSQALTLDSVYSEEIRQTAQLVVQNAVSVSLLIKSDFNANRNGPISNWDSTSRYFNTFAAKKAIVSNIHTATLQYGDPRFASEDAITFGNFNPDRTLSNLNAAGLGVSFQARVLSAGGFARVFRIQDIIDTTLGQNVIENIYTAIAVFISNCSLVYIPDPITTTEAPSSQIATSTLDNSPIITSSMAATPQTSSIAIVTSSIATSELPSPGQTASTGSVGLQSGSVAAVTTSTISVIESFFLTTAGTIQQPSSAQVSSDVVGSSTLGTTSQIFITSSVPTESTGVSSSHVPVSSTLQSHTSVDVSDYVVTTTQAAPSTILASVFTGSTQTYAGTTSEETAMAAASTDLYATGSYSSASAPMVSVITQPSSIHEGSTTVVGVTTYLGSSETQISSGISTLLSMPTIVPSAGAVSDTTSEGKYFSTTSTLDPAHSSEFIVTSSGIFSHTTQGSFASRETTIASEPTGTLSVSNAPTSASQHAGASSTMSYGAISAGNSGTSQIGTSTVEPLPSASLSSVLSWSITAHTSTTLLPSYLATEGSSISSGLIESSWSIPQTVYPSSTEVPSTQSLQTPSSTIIPPTFVWTENGWTLSSNAAPSVTQTADPSLSEGVSSSPHTIAYSSTEGGWTWSSFVHAVTSTITETLYSATASKTANEISSSTGVYSASTEAYSPIITQSSSDTGANSLNEPTFDTIPTISQTVSSGQGDISSESIATGTSTEYSTSTGTTTGQSGSNANGPTESSGAYTTALQTDYPTTTHGNGFSEGFSAGASTHSSGSTEEIVTYTTTASQAFYPTETQGAGSSENFAVSASTEYFTSTGTTTGQSSSNANGLTESSGAYTTAVQTDYPTTTHGNGFSEGFSAGASSEFSASAAATTTTQGSTHSSGSTEEIVTYTTTASQTFYPTKTQGVGSSEGFAVSASTEYPTSTGATTTPQTDSHISGLTGTTTGSALVSTAAATIMTTTEGLLPSSAPSSSESLMSLAETSSVISHAVYATTTAHSIEGSVTPLSTSLEAFMQEASSTTTLSGTLTQGVVSSMTSSSKIPPSYVWSDGIWTWSSMTASPASSDTESRFSMVTGTSTVFSSKTVSTETQGYVETITGHPTATIITSSTTEINQSIPQSATMTYVDEHTEVHETGVIEETETRVYPTYEEDTIQTAYEQQTENPTPTSSTQSATTAVDSRNGQFFETSIAGSASTDSFAESAVPTSYSYERSRIETSEGFISTIQSTATATSTLAPVSSNEAVSAILTESNQVTITTGDRYVTSSIIGSLSSENFAASAVATSYPYESSGMETMKGFTSNILSTATATQVPASSNEALIAPLTESNQVTITTGDGYMTSSTAYVDGLSSSTSSLFVPSTTGGAPEDSSTIATLTSNSVATSMESAKVVPTSHPVSYLMSAVSGDEYVATTTAYIPSVSVVTVSTKEDMSPPASLQTTKDSMMPSSTIAEALTTLTTSTTYVAISIETSYVKDEVTTTRSASSMVTSAPVSYDMSAVSDDKLVATATVYVPTVSIVTMSTKEELSPPSTSTASEALSSASHTESTVSSLMSSIAETHSTASTIPPPPEPSTFIPTSSWWSSAILDTESTVNSYTHDTHSMSSESSSSTTSSTTTVDPGSNREETVDPPLLPTLTIAYPTTTTPLQEPTSFLPSTTTSPPIETAAPAAEPPPSALPPPATIGLSVAGGVLAVGGAAAIAFMYKSGSIGASMLKVTALSDPMLQMAKANPLYQTPGGVHENPLYQPGNDTAGDPGDFGMRRGFADDVV